MDRRHLPQQGSPATVTTSRGEQRNAVMLNHDMFAAIEELLTRDNERQTQIQGLQTQIQELQTQNLVLQTRDTERQTQIQGLQTQNLVLQNQMSNNDMSWALSDIALSERLDRSRGLCGVCRDNAPNRRIRDCGHEICDICLGRIPNGVCPFCFSQIDGDDNLFLP
jgi:TolA-binding protein